MWNTFLGKRVLGFKYAFRGAWMLVKNEASIQVQLVIALIMTGVGIYFDLSALEWVLQIFAIALVLSVEALNTSIEEIANFIHPDFHSKIGYIKDISAGAVAFAAIAAIVIGCIIYIPKFQ